MVAPIAIGVGRAGLAFAKTPLGGRILAAGAGTLGGIAGMLLLGGKKGGMEQVQDAAQTTTTATRTTTYSPSYQYDYSKVISNITDSPGAAIETKKGGMQQIPSTAVSPVVQVTPSQTLAQKATEGSDLVTLALIGGGALIVYGYVTKE